jgi:AraC-like DNA-binding protein
MLKGAAPLLQHHRIFASRNLDETQAFLQTVEFFLDVHPRDVGALDFVARAAYLPGSYIGCIYYGPEALIRVPPDRRRDDFWIHFPLRGSFEVTNKAGSLTCDPARSVISSPDGHVTRSAADSARATLSVSKATMMAQLAALLGESPIRSLDFRPEFALDAPHGRTLRRHFDFVIAELDAAGAARANPLTLSIYEQLLVTALLLGQPSNYTTALARLENRVAPGDVKRAVDFIEAHLDCPITLSDIAAAAGVPGRTLLQHFKDHRGVSPMRHLRDARLARVRDALLRAAPDDSVTALATAWGFAHLGRFALEYRRRFGETPAQTRRRRARVARGAPVARISR